jgi:baseplate upper protein BppU
MPRLRTFTLMEGDLLPALQFTVQNDDGTPVDLTGASAVQFLMATLPTDFTDSVHVINSAGIFVNRPAGIVQYTWQGTDTATRGRYAGVFEITDGTGKKFSVPNDDYVYVSILARLPPT